MKKSFASLEERKKRARTISRVLKRLFPNASEGTVLKYKDPWQLMVAVRLSAQCTDKKVNEVTQELFKKYRKLDDYLRADRREFEKAVRPTGFYRSKAKQILGAAKVVKERFSGKVPRTMEEMVTIPGVGRKSANVILGNAYGIVEGIAVDTHVKRLSRLLGLTRHTDPVKIEKDLMELLPKKEWFDFTYGLIEYGRKYCPARPHDHRKCPLAGFYVKQ